MNRSKSPALPISKHSHQPTSVVKSPTSQLLINHQPNQSLWYIILQNSTKHWNLHSSSKVKAMFHHRSPLSPHSHIMEVPAHYEMNTEPILLRRLLIKIHTYRWGPPHLGNHLSIQTSKFWTCTTQVLLSIQREAQYNLSLHFRALMQVQMYCACLCKSSYSIHPSMMVLVRIKGFATQTMAIIQQLLSRITNQIHHLPILK